MKKRLIILTMFMLPAMVTMAQQEEKPLTNGQLMNYVGYGAIIITMLMIVVALLVMLHAIKVIAKVAMGAKAYKEMLAEEKAAKLARKQVRNKDKGSVMLKLMSLKPLSEEASLTMEHDFDGIRELNNPTPAWFMVLFYITIIFGIGYFLNYHVFHFGQLQYEEYQTEVNIADKEKQAWLAKAANRVDENTVKLTTDATVLASGKAIFTASCSPCHGPNAEGTVGPNLTDDYWLHGNKIGDVFKTVKYGVSAKGMPTWEKQLSPKQIADVANYIKSLHGSNPANAKEPQGEKMADGDDKVTGEKTAMLTNK